jgi:hypothetical protein
LPKQQALAIAGLSDFVDYRIYKENLCHTTDIKIFLI